MDEAVLWIVAKLEDDPPRVFTCEDPGAGSRICLSGKRKAPQKQRKNNANGVFGKCQETRKSAKAPQKHRKMLLSGKPKKCKSTAKATQTALVRKTGKVQKHRKSTANPSCQQNKSTAKTTQKQRKNNAKATQI